MKVDNNSIKVFDKRHNFTKIQAYNAKLVIIFPLFIIGVHDAMLKLMISHAKAQT